MHSGTACGTPCHHTLQAAGLHRCTRAAAALEHVCVRLLPQRNRYGTEARGRSPERAYFTILQTLPIDTSRFAVLYRCYQCTSGRPSALMHVSAKRTECSLCCCTGTGCVGLSKFCFSSVFSMKLSVSTAGRSRPRSYGGTAAIYARQCFINCPLVPHMAAAFKCFLHSIATSEVHYHFFLLPPRATTVEPLGNSGFSSSSPGPFFWQGSIRACTREWVCERKQACDGLGGFQTYTLTPCSLSGFKSGMLKGV